MNQQLQVKSVHSKAHSPLTPITRSLSPNTFDEYVNAQTPIILPMSQSSFRFSPCAIHRCWQASTPGYLDFSLPKISPIEFSDTSINSSGKLVPSDDPNSSINKVHNKMINLEVDNDLIPSTNVASLGNFSLNINNRVMDVSVILDDLALKQYSTLFEEHEIDLSVFFSLNDAKLQDIGVQDEGHREILLCLIEEFNSKSL